MNWIEIPKNIKADVTLLTQLATYTGTSQFDEIFLKTVKKVVPIIELTGFVCVKQAAPIAVGWTGDRADIESRINKYITQFYEHDPLLHQLPNKTEENKNFIGTISFSSIKNSDYRWTFFEKPKFYLEVSVIFWEVHGWNMIKCFFQQESLSRDEIKQLGELLALLYPIAKLHAIKNEENASDISRPMIKKRVIRRLTGRFPQLTQREIEVCALTILGKSTQEVADELNIANNTVLTYRQRASEKLGDININSIIQELI